MSEQALERSVQVTRETSLDKQLEQVNTVLTNLLTNYLEDLDSLNVKSCIADLFQALDAVPRWHGKQVIILNNGRILYRQEGLSLAQETVQSDRVRVIEQREIDEALDELKSREPSAGTLVQGLFRDLGIKLRDKAAYVTDTFYNKTLAGETAEDVCQRLLPIILKHLEQERQIKASAPAERPRRSYWPVIESNCAELFAALTSITTCKAVVAVQLDAEQVLLRSGQIKRLDQAHLGEGQCLTLPPEMLEKIHKQAGVVRA